MLNYVIYYVKLCDLVIFLAIIMLEWYLLSFLMTIIVFLFIVEVNLDLKLNVNLNLNWNLNLECLDQLIVVVQLPDVSHTNTNGYLYLL